MSKSTFLTLVTDALKGFGTFEVVLDHVPDWGAVVLEYVDLDIHWGAELRVLKCVTFLHVLVKDELEAQVLDLQQRRSQD